MSHIELNNDQEELVTQLLDFYYNSPEQVFQYAGPAGTGKSVVLGEFVRRAGIDPYSIAPMSYVGAAAINMRTKGLLNAKTIHSWIYEPQLVDDPNKIDKYYNRPMKKLIFVKKPILDGIPKKIILIDEAGTVPCSLKKDIESFGIKIIACGDLEQLPPVRDNPAYLYTGKVYRLTQIMRQNKDNAIIYLASQLLQNITPQPGIYGNVIVMYDTDISDSILSNANAVICGKNNTRDKFNKYIREHIFGFSGNLPCYGERMICRKNNWKVDSDGINLANGLVGTVTNIPGPTTFDGKTYTIDFVPDAFNGKFSNLKCDYKYLMGNVQEREMIKKFSFKESGEKFEFAYAITTHISQGSQYDHGIYIQEYLNRNINRHLNYTGITRFRRWCFYVLPTRKYY